ncbi:maleylpyruvate isomerase N-terminal domain-containing protein [Nocardioides ginsengisegetis]|uniref:maleylpyruvate isomerase N-terminal domain-containing protein n=1 Tax=Nocardioides ginsengisegetis TaxID=661491 RepID=UPI003CCE3FCC
MACPPSSPRPSTSRDCVLPWSPSSGTPSGPAFARPVPTCPDWTVRHLVAHQGMVHRWGRGGAPRRAGRPGRPRTRRSLLARPAGVAARRGRRGGRGGDQRARAGGRAGVPARRPAGPGLLGRGGSATRPRSTPSTRSRPHWVATPAGRRPGSTPCSPATASTSCSAGSCPGPGRGCGARRRRRWWWLPRTDPTGGACRSARTRR